MNVKFLAGVIFLISLSISSVNAEITQACEMASVRRFNKDFTLRLPFKNFVWHTDDEAFLYGPDNNLIIVNDNSGGDRFQFRIRSQGLDYLYLINKGRSCDATVPDPKSITIVEVVSVGANTH